MIAYMFVVCWSSFVVGGSSLKKQHFVKIKMEPTGRSALKMTDENTRPFRQRSTLYSNNESHLL